MGKFPQYFFTPPDFVKYRLSIEYLTDQNGQTKAVVIPIELWRQVFPQEDMSCEEFTEAIEDYCLNQAMDEAQQSPLLAIEEALAYLEE
ncbi:MAG: hypothetical protein GPJ27_12490 [Microcystis aeruginosa L111-01]|nr:hypothetical protein [Microcystis aeruginosa L111-01]